MQLERDGDHKKSGALRAGFQASVGRLLLPCLWCAVSSTALATEPKLDALTCADLRLERQKAIEAGLAADVAKGPEWAKSSLNQERIHQIELFIAVDEQVKFGCRDAKITEDARAAAEAARRLELNPDADPLAASTVRSADDDESNASESAEPDGALKRPATPDGVNKAKAAKAKAEKKKVSAGTSSLEPPRSRPGDADSKPNSNDAYRPPAGTESVLKSPPETNPLVP